jgi:drug/metabolite transporter (DMT)-like permease
VFDSFATLGLQASAAGFSPADLLKPGLVAAEGLAASQPIFDHIGTIAPGPIEFFANLAEVILLCLGGIGALFSLPFSLQSFATADWAAFSGWDWFSILYIVVLGTLAANLLMNWGVQQWGPSKTGSFVYFQPVFGTLGAALLMGEQFSAVKAISGLLIVAGVWITSLKLKKENPA